MDFGKLADISRVDFRLPKIETAWAERNARVLRAQGGPKIPASFHCGAPIWSQKQWVGKVYPLGTRSPDFLKLYTRQFNGIELNGTHYHIPSVEQVRAWHELAPPGFQYCPKFPQEISHAHELERCEPLTRLFCETLAGLGDRMGTSFLQLSPYFTPGKIRVLERFLKSLTPGFPVCVEFRHADWFRNGMLIDSALDVLEAHGAGTVITDTAGRRDVVHGSITGPRLLVRFVGNELDPTDYTRIDEWVLRIKEWMQAGLTEIHFFIHQPENDLAPELLSYLITQMNASTGIGLKNWEQKDQGRQLSLL